MAAATTLSSLLWSSREKRWFKFLFFYLFKLYEDTLWDLTLVTRGNYFDTKMCFVTCSVLGYDDHVGFSFQVGTDGGVRYHLGIALGWIFVSFHIRRETGKSWASFTIMLFSSSMLITYMVSTWCDDMCNLYAHSVYTIWVTFEGVMKLCVCCVFVVCLCLYVCLCMCVNWI